MADISAIKLPDNNTYNVKDSRINSTDITSWNSKAAGTHTHGDLTNAGDITASATIASGDRLVINDESASKITNSSITRTINRHIKIRFKSITYHYSVNPSSIKSISFEHII